VVVFDSLRLHYDYVLESILPVFAQFCRIAATCGSMHQEIADATGILQRTISNRIESLSKNGNVSEIGQTLSFDRDNDFTPPLYNVWTFAKKTNAVSHFGNSEQRIVDNLLYLYTNPLDIVVDPFAE